VGRRLGVVSLECTIAAVACKLRLRPGPRALIEVEHYTGHRVHLAVGHQIAAAVLGVRPAMKTLAQIYHSTRLAGSASSGGREMV
jgi:hypothetical protein